jgi:DNA invertase Pin-like site-specific DNA recombinase
VLLCQSCHAKAHHRDKRMSTSELTREALAKKKERGERLGRPPFGTVSFRGKLVPGKDFETVRRVLELRSERVKREGAWTTLQPMSYRLIAERMTEETGSVWSYAKVARIVNQWGDLARLDREVRNTSGTDEREE